MSLVVPKWQKWLCDTSKKSAWERSSDTTYFHTSTHLINHCQKRVWFSDCLLNSGCTEKVLNGKMMMYKKWMLGCRSVKSLICYRPIHTHKISRSWTKRQQWIIFPSERTKLQVEELYNLVPMKTNLDSAAFNNIKVNSRIQGFLWQLWGLSCSKIKMLPCTKPDDCDVIHWQKEGLFFLL